MNARLKPLAVIPALWGSLAFAQGYPSRPITLIYPFGTGSASEVVMRAMIPGASKALGQPVYRLLGGSHGIDDEVIVASDFLGIHPLLGIEGAVGAVAARNFAGERAPSGGWSRKRA